MKLETDFPLVLRTLVNGQIDFIAVGAVAAIAQGVIATTEDVDVVYSREPENLKRIVATLAPFEPYLRGSSWIAISTRRTLFAKRPEFHLRNDNGER